MQFVQNAGIAWECQVATLHLSKQSNPCIVFSTNALFLGPTTYLINQILLPVTFLFPKIKFDLNGKRFQDIKGMQQRVRKMVFANSEDDFRKCLYSETLLDKM